MTLEMIRVMLMNRSIMCCTEKLASYAVPRGY